MKIINSCCRPIKMIFELSDGAEEIIQLRPGQSAPLYCRDKADKLVIVEG